MVVGVTGKYCAGKNAVTEVLVHRGFRSIDVDRLGHDVLILKKADVVSTFGDSILDTEGSIDRRALGRIVFADPTELRRLEAITHPAMVQAAAAEIARVPGENVVVHAAILYRMGLHTLCDVVIWVEANLATRFLRALRRDRLPVGEVVRRIWSQRKLSPQPFRNLVDTYIVRNSGKRKRLEAVVSEAVKAG